jgi:glyoxylase-like metal-dependent hydrolase (beta-lactamase superfamily II)
MRAAAGTLLATLIAARTVAAAPRAPEVRPELEYLKSVNAAAPPRDPPLVVLLMQQFANANRHGEGIEFFSARLAQFDRQLTDVQRALYLAAIASLRAGHATDVAPAQRAAWGAETTRLFGEAKRLTQGQLFLVRWLSATATTDEGDAQVDLTWCVENAAKAPSPGLLRPVYLRLAALQRKQGHADKAAELVRLSGVGDPDPRVALTTPSSLDPDTGLAIGPRRIVDLVPGKVYAVYGFDFSDFHFVVSEDHRQLVAVDAGTRYASAKAAYEALRAHAPGLPPLTTVLVTHGHPDHVGGHRFFRELDSHPKFYARENYAGTIAAALEGPRPRALPSATVQAARSDLAAYKPDVLVAQRTDLVIGGTRFELVPIHGGETADAMLIHLPDLGLMFVGDFANPFLGNPYREEGSFDGLLEAFDEVIKRNPTKLLHGHGALTVLMPTPSVLAHLRGPLSWLRDQTLAGIQKGLERGQLQQENLIPPGLLEQPDLHIPYLVFRENMINRLYDQHVGPWQPDLEGLDNATQADRGALIVEYLGVNENRLNEALGKLIADGRYELAANLLEWTDGRFPRSARIQDARRLVYGKLVEKYQGFNVFKFAAYAAKAGQALQPVGVPAAP